MSQSPEEARREADSSYERGWVSIHRMLRQGASWSGNERHCAFLNSGDGKFLDVSAVSGLDLNEDGRAAVVTDWNGDGAQDLWIMARTGPRLRLLRNVLASERESFQLELKQPIGNRDAIGARAELVLANGQRVVRSVRAGSGYLSQSSLWMHFGWPSEGGVRELRVIWPGSEVENFRDIQSGRWTLTRGGALASAPNSSSESVLRSEPVTKHASPSSARIPVGVRLPMPPLNATVTGGVSRELLTHYRGRALLVLPWASWCAPCLEELRSLVAEKAQLVSSGLTILALNADMEPEGRRTALRFLREIEWPFEVAQADKALIDVLDLVQQHTFERRRRLPLPSSFLIDPEGRLAVFSRGELSTNRIVLDALSLQDDPIQVRNSSVPFAGRWRGEPLEPDSLGLETRLRKAGYEDVAQAYYQRWFSEEVTASVGVAKTHVEFGKVFMRQLKLTEAAKHLREATVLDPQFVEAWVLLATVVHRQGNRPTAIEAYERALALDMDNVQGRFNYSLALAELGRFGEALSQASKLDSIAPEFAVRLRTEISRLQSGSD